jgi:isopentenyl-diphosphate delta-isomerase
MEVATRRRLREELDIHADLELVYKFSYRAQFGEHGSENELCSVFLGRTDQTYSANANEIAEARFVTVETLQNELRKNPEEFTPWFKMEWERLSGEFMETLAAYAK